MDMARILKSKISIHKTSMAIALLVAIDRRFLFSENSCVNF